MALQAADINDLAIATLNELGKARFNQINTDLQYFEVMGRLLKAEKVITGSGKGIQRNLQVTTSGAARNVGLFEVDDVNVGESMKQIDIPWRHSETSWAFDLRESSMNNGPEEIFDTIKSRRIDSMVSLAELMERDFWSKPTDSSDTKKIFGVKYWIVSSQTEGFNGGDPSGFTSGAGNLKVADVSRWKNYTASYTNIQKDDLIRKMRTGHRLTNFRSPVDNADYRRGRGQRYRYYVNSSTMGLFEEIGEAQNENLGRDLASMDGTMTFRSHPIVFIPELDSDATNPIYGIDYAWFAVHCLRGHVMRETPPKVTGDQHNVRESFIDISWNVLCTNRRQQQIFVLAT